METKFENTLYIAKPAEAVWNALTEKETVDQYFMAPVHTLTLEEGGRISYGVDSEMIFGTILKFEKPRLLKHTFQFSGTEDPETTVTYRIKSIGEKLSALTISQTGFPEENQTFANIQGGWPVIASSLKTLLETGDPLPWPDAEDP